jgi:AraC family transcriptional regulator
VNQISANQIESHLDARIDAPGVSIQLRTLHLTEGTELFGPRSQHHLIYLISGHHEGHSVYPEQRFRDAPRIQWGRLAFVPQDLALRFRTAGGCFTTCQCDFEPSRFAALSGSSISWDFDRLPLYIDIHNSSLVHAVRRLEREVRSPGFAHDTLADAIATSIIIELSRYFHGAKTPHKLPKTGLASWQIRRIEEYTREVRPGTSMTIATFADLCGVSAPHLVRLFKKTTGQTIHAYVESIRIEQAKALLSENKLPLKRIATESGFSTSSYFSAAFRRVTGETPKEFRKRTLVKRTFPMRRV